MLNLQGKINFPKCIILIFVLFSFVSSVAQTRDTLFIYKKIKKIAIKHKFTTLIYYSIFVDPAPHQYENKPLSDNQKKKDPNLKYEGKIIRNINITVYDPFGYSVSDTSRKEINPFQKLANHYHITSKHWIIRNKLLFKKNDELTLLSINESERVLRAANDFVNDAQIYIEPINNSKDSVDIHVVVLDKWAIDATASVSITSANIYLRDRNFLGFGQRIAQSGGYNTGNGEYSYGGNFLIDNVKNSFISSTLFYSTSKDVTSGGFAFDRPFYTVTTKWAGGIAFNKTWGVYKTNDTTKKIENKYTLNYINSDVWIGRSYNPGFGIPENRKGTNFIVALRYLNTYFQQRPGFAIDTNKTLVNYSLVLGSVGFSLRKYYKDQFIYRFGANEDVPEGILIQYLQGYSYKEETGFQHYSGFQIDYGKHFDNLGYISINSTYGSFYNEHKRIDASLNSGINYFSKLYQNNKWYFRQFVNFKYIIGINKTALQTIAIRDDELYGITTSTNVGNSKMIVNLEAVTYAPYNAIGFRFAPLVLVGLGMLETKENTLLKSHIYQAYAVGLLLRNENLLNSSFQITFGFYPNSTDDNKSISKFNPIAGFSLKVRSFVVSKPSVVEYN